MDCLKSENEHSKNVYIFLGLAPTGRLRRVGSRAGVASFGAILGHVGQSHCIGP